MQPDRKKVIGEHKVEEFYWAGKMVVYIDNRLTEKTFDDACKDLRKEHVGKMLSS